MLRFLTGCYKRLTFAAESRYMVRCDGGDQTSNRERSGLARSHVHDVAVTLGGRVSQLRFGAADFISTRPLLHGLQRSGASLHFETPGALADSLAQPRKDSCCR